jgi:hypothetical protein
MSLVANIAPPAVCILVCVIAYVSVRRAHRKGREAVRRRRPRPDRPSEAWAVR